ncbi:hypothetical protein sce5692 [Sorangium cellulosum So ce56]|uniref:Uncharacterized protein n=1 Tax=Sorangium cellulosum (strain So ce56) TaxID=448385 RepID=A9G7G4_SORC5|nr:hypothetical protein [Sorangium cellulosum]CAN95855.1 hypothetical protein sce5692 [Sorangium cellulosum So ce56]
MHKGRSESNDSKDILENPGNEQFPVDTRVVTRIRLFVDRAGVDLARIVLMNDQATPQHSPYREYHHGNAGVLIDGVTSLSMHADAIACSQQAIEGFVGTMPMHLDLLQSAKWRRGVCTSSAAHKRLFKAIDPDDSTKMIGLLIEQDQQGRLERVTWYKTRDARTLFHATPEKLTFEMVKDENGAPSLDPSDIGGWTWFYTTSPFGS